MVKQGFGYLRVHENWWGYSISPNKSWGWLFLILNQKGAIIRGRRLFQIILTGSRALNICFIFPLNQKIITLRKLNVVFLSVQNLVPWLIVRAWIVTDQFCWIRFDPLQLDREEVKERGDGERNGGDYSIEGDDYFKYFHQRGAIIWGRRLIEGQLLFEEIRYLKMWNHYVREKQGNPTHYH